MGLSRVAGIAVLLLVGLALVAGLLYEEPTPDVVVGDFERGPARHDVTLSGKATEDRPVVERGAERDAEVEVVGRDRPLPPRPPFLVAYVKERTPIDVLEGIVVRGAERVGDGRALLWRGPFGTTSAGIPFDEAPDEERRIGRDGTFRFEGVEPGSLWVGVALPGEPLRLRHVAVRTRYHTNSRVVFHLGHAGVGGHVYESDGRAAVGVQVRASPRRGDGGLAQVTTDTSGAYRLEGLQPVRHWITVQPREGEFANTLLSQRVLLEAGEVRELDFGRAEGLVEFRGVVRTRTGEPVRGPARILLSRAHGDGYVEFRYGADGAYAHAVEPGTYRVNVTLAGGNRGPVQLEDVLDVGDDGHVQDLVVPGARVRGEVRGLPDPESGQRPLGLRLVWAPNDTAGGWALQETRVRPDGSYLIDGVAPGTYRMRAHPWDVKGVDGREAVFEVTAGTTTLTLDLEARPPERR